MLSRDLWHILAYAKINEMISDDFPHQMEKKL